MQKDKVFGFERLTVYAKAKGFYRATSVFIKESGLGRPFDYQLSRAALSVVLNIAEGSGRFSHADKRHLYVMSRSSLYECVALFDVLREEGALSSEAYKSHYERAEELSKILLAMIQNLKKP